MSFDLSLLLKSAAQKKSLPYIIAYNRIDGPGSSLDLREFQQALWYLPEIPKDYQSDISMEWSRNLPRTVGITIDTGTKIEAHPFKPDSICVRSIEYGTEVTAKSGDVPPTRENWLLKILDLFRLSGVMFVLQNIRAGIQSAGLGGSATATTGACILANELRNRPFSEIQIISLSSRLEQDLGVSITGTQEQSNVIFGGVMDYLWFPWGIPGRPETNYGESLRFELIPHKDYQQIEKRMAIFHSGITRPSLDVNAVWRSALSSKEGYRLHSRKPEIAYQFREGLRLQNWEQVLEAIREYRKLRTTLCNDYINGSHEILGRAESKGGTAFPLGAGGGGGILVFASDPDSLKLIRKDLQDVYREIPFRIKSKGYELFNFPIEGR